MDCVNEEISAAVIGSIVCGAHWIIAVARLPFRPFVPDDFEQEDLPTGLADATQMKDYARTDYQNTLTKPAPGPSIISIGVSTLPQRKTAVRRKWTTKAAQQP